MRPLALLALIVPITLTTSIHAADSGNYRITSHNVKEWLKTNAQRALPTPKCGYEGHQLAWSCIQGAEIYVLRLQEPSAAASEIRQWARGCIGNSNPTITTDTQTRRQLKLKPNTRYQWSVMAHNVSGDMASDLCAAHELETDAKGEIIQVR